MKPRPLHVLIGFSDALPAPEVYFSLRRAGYDISALIRRGQHSSLTRRLPLRSIFEIDAPESDLELAADGLRAIMDGPNAPDFFLPLDDAALFLAEQSLGLDTRIAGATGRQARAALDKEIQIEAARTAGLDVPPTRVARSCADLLGILDFPVIAKPALANASLSGRLGKLDAVYLADQAEVVSFSDGFEGRDATFLVQPLIEGVGEGVFGFVGPTGVSHWSGHRRVRMMNPHGSGSSACISIVPDVELRAKVATFVTMLGWRGPFMVELLRDAAGKAWFMELNGRMWGSMAIARRAGLEYPAWAVAQADNPAFLPPVLPEPVPGLVARHLGREALHVLFVARGPKSVFHKTNWPGLFGAVKSATKPARPSRFYNYDPDFPRFFLSDAAWTVRRALMRRKS